MGISAIYPSPTGLSGDIRGESGTTNINSNTWEPVTDCTLSGDIINFPTNTAGAKAFIRFSRDADLGFERMVVVMELRVSAAPTSEIGVISTYAEGGAHTVGVGTDRRLYVYNPSGTLIMTSQTQIPTAGFARVVLVSYDTAANAHWSYLYINGVQEGVAQGPVFSNGSADQYCYGEWLAAGVARGADLIMRRMVCLRLDASPTTTPMPDVIPVGGKFLPPTSEGTYAQWNNGTTASPNTWQDVDDYPGNDDTNRIAETDDQTLSHTFRYSAANPVPAGATVHAIQWGCVGRVVETGKEFANPLIRFGGTDAAGVGLQPTTTYRGFGSIFMKRPDGTAWQRGDFEPGLLEFGARTIFIIDTGAAITSMPGPVIFYSTSSLPLAKLPVQGASPTFMGLGLGVL